MPEVLSPLAAWLQAILPDFVRLPSLTFELPHIAYWVGLVIFPLIAMYLVTREGKRSERGRVSQPIAWLLWVGGGFVGLHRFYLRAHRLGFVYIVLFVGILYGNRNGAVALDAKSLVRNDLLGAEFDVERFQKAVEAGTEGAAAKLAQAEQLLATSREALAAAVTAIDDWQAFAGGLGLVIVALLVFDALRMRHLAQRCEEREAREPVPESRAIDRGMVPNARQLIRTPVTDLIERINGYVGHFICYWAVIAVFIYYYEVLARYVFNSPTNWAHESMFLMFGMQYLLSGGFALREDAHVRVDIIYEQFPERTKAIIDLITSIFFFIFVITLLVTGFIFARDAINVWEVSFTEWSVQYWPVKCTIALGAILIIAQGLAKLIKDAAYLGGTRG